MANDEDLARIRQGVAVWNDWRARNRESPVDLCGANLSGADLRGANLSGADLRGANLRGADLRGADLSRANLSGANLRGAKLSGADLSGATLRFADLCETDLRIANLEGADLSGADLGGKKHLDSTRVRKRLVIGAITRWHRRWRGRGGRGPKRGWPDLPADVYARQQRTLPAGDRGDRALDLCVPGSVHFTVYHPKEIKPKVWYTLLAYVHTLKMQSTVEADAKQRLEVPHGRRTAEATRGIIRGAEIVVTPELPGCRFNPTSARLLWLEDWHRVEFRLQAQPDFAGFELGKAVNGRVAFYVESVLVGEVPIWTCISNEADTTAADAPASAEPYEAIFVSYAHEDSAVVDRLSRAYKVLGMEFLKSMSYATLLDALFALDLTDSELRDSTSRSLRRRRETLEEETLEEESIPGSLERR